jgi:hypothetical protein
MFQQLQYERRKAEFCEVKIKEIGVLVYECP